MIEDDLTDWLGPAPSPKQIEYLEQQNNRRLKIKKLFEEWFEEMEGYSFRSERFYDDFDYAAKTGDYKMIVKWLQTSFEEGYKKRF